MKLKNWFKSRTVIWGNVYNDEKGRFSDGTLIHTSRILEIYEKDGKKYAKTLNSTYELEGVEYRGKWVEGLPYKHPANSAEINAIILQGVWYENDFDGIYGRREDILPATVGQYTTRDDKNGKKIFEGDIAKCHNGVTEYTAKVVRDIYNPYFALEYKSEYGFDDLEYDFVLYGNIQIEVISTIFDKEQEGK